METDAPGPEPTYRGAGEPRVRGTPRATGRGTHRVDRLVPVGHLLGQPDVITADGGVADIGSFRGASAFLDDYLRGYRNTWREGDDMRFYMGTIFIRQRADLTPVYVMIFRRLSGFGADWIYHFSELFLTEFAGTQLDNEEPTRYSVSDGAVTELNAQKDRAKMARFRADVAQMNAGAREAAMDRPPPATVRAAPTARCTDTIRVADHRRDFPLRDACAGAPVLAGREGADGAGQGRAAPTERREASRCANALPHNEGLERCAVG